MAGIKCKVCGVPHGFGEPHVWSGKAETAADSVPVSAQPATLAKSKKVVKVAAGDEKDAIIAELRAKLAEYERDALALKARKEKHAATMRARRKHGF